jgi:predicted NAD-dependent protein-ADP-ribosyltransferase YbiA (DUF1768 family)
MVHSKIRPEIEYKEIRIIDDEDNEYESSIYETEIDKKDVAIAFGKIKYTYTGKNILYYPIYLISENVVKSRIGVLELDAKELSKYTNEDDDIDVEKYAMDGNQFLLYKFVNNEFLELSKSDPQFYKNELKPESTNFLTQEEKEVEDEDEEDVFSMKQKDNLSIKEKEEKEEKEEKGVFKPIGNADIPDLLKEETKSDADKLINKTANANWVQKFMKNGEYRLHKTSPDGDCFFTVILEAFRQIGKKTTIEDLREIVADSLTQETFDHYSYLQVAIKAEIDGNQTNIHKISDKIKEYKKRFDKVADKSEKERILDAVKLSSEDKKEFAKKNDSIVSDDYYNQFRFMEGVNSLEEMRAAVKKSSYWADEIAIEEIEQKLNIKMIILSKENYDSGSEDTVMKCSVGSNKNPIPKPDYYIMTAYTGNHYDLISYKDKKILEFSEIPYHIKALIVNKCVEKNAGIFHHISDFRRFQERFGINPVENSYSAEPSDLYDDDIHFMFYEKSADKKPPGTGSGEKIGKQDLLQFTDLQIVTNWRRMLDDEYVSPFSFDGKQWQTVEHYYQASKFKKGFPDFYVRFSLDSESEICNDVKKAKAAGGKMGKYRKELGFEKVSLDPDFYGGRDNVERANALMAKFENPQLRKVLIGTKKAKLLHFVRGSEPEVDTLLMELRVKMSRL